MTGTLIVDDHPLVLGVLRRMAEEGGAEHVWEAQDAVSAYRMFHKHRPAVCVIDISFDDSDLSGLSLIRRMRALEAGARILALSMHDDPVIVAQALRSGALGYASKGAPIATVAEAFETVREGRSYLAHDLATRVAMLTITDPQPAHGRLNTRELQVLSLLSRGKSYKLIAAHLSISQRNVITLCSDLRRKLGVRTLAELIHFAMLKCKNI